MLLSHPYTKCTGNKVFYSDYQLFVWQNIIKIVAHLSDLTPLEVQNNIRLTDHFEVSVKELRCVWLGMSHEVLNVHE